MPVTALVRSMMGKSRMTGWWAGDGDDSIERKSVLCPTYIPQSLYAASISPTLHSIGTLPKTKLCRPQGPPPFARLNVTIIARVLRAQWLLAAPLTCLLWRAKRMTHWNGNRE